MKSEFFRVVDAITAPLAVECYRAPSLPLAIGTVCLVDATEQGGAGDKSFREGFAARSLCT